MLNDESKSMNNDENFLWSEQEDCLIEAEDEEKLFQDTHWTLRGKQRPCAWVRKHEYKERLRQRYQIMHHQGINPGEYGMRLGRAIFVTSYDPTDWRTHSYVNYHQNLYISPRGDIRVYNGYIAAYPRIFAPVPASQRKLVYIQTNRRIRHVRNAEEGIISYSCLKKMFTRIGDGL